MRTPIEYEPIPEGPGHVALTIYPPGTWFNTPAYCVFVGGSGVGHCKTLKAAEALLLEKAKEDMRHRSETHKRAMLHAESQLTRLGVEGLKRKGPEQKAGDAQT